MNEFLEIERERFSNFEERCSYLKVYFVIKTLRHPEWQVSVASTIQIVIIIRIEIVIIVIIVKNDNLC